jgi:hypothetical protein
MSSDNPYQAQPGPYGQGGQGAPPPGPYGYPEQNTPPGPASYTFGPFAPQQDPTLGVSVGVPPELDTAPGPVEPAPGPVPGPTQQPAGPRRRNRTFLVLGVVALALILVVVIAALLLWRSQRIVAPRPGPSQAPATAASSAPSSAPPAAALASDAVIGYLNALAAGDAAAALSYSADPVKPGPFLTDKVLASSIKRAPLQAITVPQVTDQQATSVAATYRLGKTEVTTSYKVVKASGEWKLAAVSKTIDLGLVRSASIPMLINGVKVNSDYVDLLPGSYAFTTASPHLTYGSRNVVTITDPNGYANVFDLRASLSERGRKTVIDLANRSYDGCLRTKVPRPRNCPFSWTNPVYRFRGGSATWRQIGTDPFRTPKVQLVGSSARLRIPLRVRISGPCTFSGTSGTCRGRVTGEGLAAIRLDRDKLSVVWLS